MSEGAGSRWPASRVTLSDGVISLRWFDDADVDGIAAACQDPHIQRFIPIPRPYGRADAVSYVARTRRQWRDGTKAAFAIVDVAAPALVLGAISLSVCGSAGNAAYWVAPSARRRGVAVRALRLLSDWALDDLGLGVIILEIRPENRASQQVAVAAGYHQAGRLDVNTETGERDGLVFSRLAVTSFPLAVARRPGGPPVTPPRGSAPTETAAGLPRRRRPGIEPVATASPS